MSANVNYGIQSVDSSILSNNEISNNASLTHIGVPDDTSISQSATNQVLQESDESHLVEDRALERLGRLLNAPSSAFAQREDPNITQVENNFTNQDITSTYNNDDVMSTSDSSSHLWQGISGNGNYIII